MLTNQDGIWERIIQIRKERGLSQNQLAKDFGISRTHYCNVENGKRSEEHTSEFPEHITAT